jgi:hypothetical protein
LTVQDLLGESQKRSYFSKRKKTKISIKRSSFFKIKTIKKHILYLSEGSWQSVRFVSRRFVGQKSRRTGSHVDPFEKASGSS